MFFTAAGRRIGSFSVNRIRIVLALLLLTGAHTFLFGLPWPTNVTCEQLCLLAGSGVIGLAIGDSFLFRSFIVLGAKGSTLMMTLWPALAFLLAWALLGEPVDTRILVGMAVTLTGVAVSVGARRGAVGGQVPRPTVGGILLAFGGAMGQALGYVVAKPALVHPDGPEALPALSGTLIRMATAAAVLWCVEAGRLAGARLRSQPNPARVGTRDMRALAQTAAGAICGPFLGVWLSLKAVQETRIGVATTIMSTVPILVIPWTFLVYGEKPRWAEIAGAGIAVAGVALLFR